MSILDSLKSIQGVIKNTTNAGPGDYEIDICAFVHGDGGATYPFGNLVTGIAVFENIETHNLQKSWTFELRTIEIIYFGTSMKLAFVKLVDMMLSKSL